MSIKKNLVIALLSIYFAIPPAFAVDAVDAAASFLSVNGSPEYIDGGNGPIVRKNGTLTTKTGFDCSGLTWYVFGHFGIEIENQALTQSEMSVGIELLAPNITELQRGDLLFFDTRTTSINTINHVGIYEGNGKFIQASSPDSGNLVRSDLATGFILYNYEDPTKSVHWQDRLLSARRLPAITGTPSSKFSVSDDVLVTENTENGVSVQHLRTGYLLTTDTTNKKSGDKGKITFGPVKDTVGGTSHWWWLVDFESGVDGWVAEDYLKKPTAAVPTCDFANPIVPCDLDGMTYDTFAGNYSGNRSFYKASSYDVSYIEGFLCLSIKSGLPHNHGYSYIAGYGATVWTSPPPYNVNFGIFGAFSGSCIEQINQFEWIGLGSAN